MPEAEAAPDPLLPPDEKWFETPALPEGDETALQEVLLAGSGRGADGPAAPLSLLVQARRLPAGARVLISPRRLGPANPAGATWSWSAPSPGGEVLPEIPLELAVELYPDAAGVWPELTEVGELGLRCTALGDRDPPRPDGKPFRALRLSFAGHNGPHVEIARSAPATWTLTKMPKTLLLRQRLLPDPRAPREAGAFVFYLGGELDARPPELSPLLLNKRLTPAGDFVEGAVRVYGGGADPYAYGELSVVAEIALPENAATPARILQAPCFFREGPSWAPAEGEWRFRFAPPGEGTYGVRLAAELRGRVTRGEKAVAFVAGPPADHGFVRVRAGERVLRFDDGSVFVPVGLSLPWPEKKGDADWFRRMFANLARQGGDATRVWLCSWGLPLEQPRAGRFDPDTAAALDEILVAAQARGLYVILVAENAYDVAKLSKEHPYFRELGGPLSAVPEFFRDADALRLFRRRLTYLAARYGAYRAVLAWELLNEADQAWNILRKDPDDPRLPAADADRARAARRDVLNWAVQGAQHLQALDIHAHPVTFSMSLWPGEVWGELEQAPG
ncbi:MAG: hypothetical protein ABSB58_12930, partial [Gemmatimonadales bacterium]